MHNYNIPRVLRVLREKFEDFREVDEQVLLNLFASYHTSWPDVNYTDLFDFHAWATKSPLQRELER